MKSYSKEKLNKSIDEFADSLAEIFVKQVQLETKCKKNYDKRTRKKSK